MSAPAPARRRTAPPTAEPRPKRPRVDPAAALRPVSRLLDRPLADYHLVLGATALLLVLGLVMVLSASSVMAYADSGSSFSIVEKQLMWVAVGVPLMVAASRVPLSLWRRLAYPAMAVAIGLLCLLLVPGVGRSVNGNTNWIDFGGPFRIQPSEAAKFALVLWGADLLARKQRLLDQWRHLLIPLLPVAFGVIALVLVGGDLGTALVLMAIVRGAAAGGGRPDAAVRAAGRRRAGADRGHVGDGPAPDAPLPVLAEPGERPARRRLAGPARQVRAGQRRLVGPRPGRQPGEVGQPPGGAHRLHLRGGGRGARPPRHGDRAAAVRGARAPAACGSRCGPATRSRATPPPA